jgi:hypothetical protein
MRRIADLSGQRLKWEQPSALKMEYELRTEDGELAATLRFRSSFGSFATAESADGCWTFKRVGFWQTRVTVRPCGSDDDIAIFKNNTWSGGGTLELSSERTFRATTNCWQSKFAFETEAGERLIEFETGGLLHLWATVGIQPSIITMTELPLMVTLGLYLIVMIRIDTTTAAAVGGAAG